jgi:hypothetical protein
LVSANLKDQLPGWTVKLLALKGSQDDFNSEWFASMGDTIVGSLVINIFIPIVLEAVWFLKRYLYRLYDKLGAPEEAPTKSGTIQKYVNIHRGPEY